MLKEKGNSVWIVGFVWYFFWKSFSNDKNWTVDKDKSTSWRISCGMNIG